MTLHELIMKLEDVGPYLDTYKVEFRCLYTERINLELDNIIVDAKTKTITIDLKDKE